jgi:hypothetical protein
MGFSEEFRKPTNMEDRLSGKKRPRMEGQETATQKCCCCEKCDFRFQEIIALKQELNDKIHELNNLIQSIHYRFNEKGSSLSYIS